MRRLIASLGHLNEGILGSELKGAYILNVGLSMGAAIQELPQVFTPFFRASNASSRHFSGVGLGLYLCQNILQAHGGSITVTSREGQGTTFLISLPTEDQQHGEQTE
ncbi:hypothetical protein KDH_65510 [Dictyobacter sp. S3.2.2.5]|uniref:histidine kinase n=1 Tax=Dictyobacter halimunensis TaxID=3026934 RepID=A0ABQ6G509_9CHLR|nr:hypothetical protein KDH_65510 [Dictyobacter sp. S3.2.2.5]